MSIYVIQTVGGRERKMMQLITAIADDDVIREIFVPQSEASKRRNGVRRIERRVVFPGYVFVDTDDVARLLTSLKRIPELTRILGDSTRFIPLTDQELSWLESLTGPHDRVVRISHGVIKNGQVHIIDGPLKDHSADIVFIDRHKRLAKVRMDMFGRTCEVSIGLEIVSKE